MFRRVYPGHALLRACQGCVRRPSSILPVARSVRISPESRVLTARAFHASPYLRSASNTAAAAEQFSSSAESEKAQLITTFDELAKKGLVDKNIINAVTRNMGLSTMTEVQTATINETLKSIDVVAQAKTGTGKTLAFLIPVLQNILMKDPLLGEKRSRYHRGASGSSDIRALIVSPTRELAEQIAEEARKVVRNTGIVVQTAVGGTRKREGLINMQRQGCHLVVGTPGRLLDIFSDPSTGVSAPKLGAFVLDEADRLLDIGFAPDIERLQSYLPSRNTEDRQTLMFSATVPHGVMNLIRRTMKPNFSFVNTIKEDEIPTHVAVPQRAVFMKGYGNQLPVIVEMAKQAMLKHKNDPSTNRPFKAIVYYNSTSEVSLAREAFESLREKPEDIYSPHPIGIRTVEMHSRLTQAQRTRNSDIFRRTDSGILFSSDVTARGMDFPDVTHVIQMGIPRDTESYIHRLGRTARANKTGEGWIFFPDVEFSLFKTKLGRLPIKEDSTTLQTAMVDMAKPGDVSPSANATIAQVKEAYKRVPSDQKRKTFLSSLGSLQSLRDTNEGIRLLNDASTSCWGLPQPPAISRQLANKIGLSKVRGLNIDDGMRSSPGHFGDRGFSRDGGSPRSGGFSRDGGFSRGGGSSRGGGFSRDGGPPRSGGFSRDGGSSRGGGFSRDRGPPRERGFSREPSRGSGNFGRY